VFAAGDVASLDPPVAKAGVYAVREAPILARNLLAALTGAPLTPYLPQSHFLSLISLGSRRAVASWGRLNFEGPLIWRLKDHIDRKFMRRYASQ
jgi:selenide,water dikinase